jgi:hypothetical protein
MPCRKWSRCIFLAAALTLTAQALHDPAELLANARPRILETISHLPKYTCTQTINRNYFHSLATRPSLRSCDDLVALKRQGELPVELDATDRARLDVAVGEGGRELYSWVGASKIDSDSIDRVIGGGPSGTGSFGSFLIDIFGQTGIDFHYLMEQPEAGQPSTLEYRFQVPLRLSHYRLLYAGRARVFPYDGRFRLAPDSAELKHLSVRTGELPNDSGVCEATTAVDFNRTRVGAGEYLLPLRSSLRFLRRNGDETENITTFSACHEYNGESTVRFDATGEITTTVAAPAQQASKPLPLGLTVSLSLLDPIDTATAAAGDPVTARVASPILDVRKLKIVAAPGALVHGRITRLEHHLQDPNYFLIAMVFTSMESTSMESKGVTVPFAARLRHQVEYPLGGRLRGIRAHTELAASGTFAFEIRQEHYIVPKGFEWDWVTAAAKN